MSGPKLLQRGGFCTFQSNFKYYVIAYNMRISSTSNLNLFNNVAHILLF